MDSTQLFLIHFFAQKNLPQVAAESSLCLALIFVFVLLSACTAPPPHPETKPWGPGVTERTERETLIAVAGGMVQSTNQEQNYRWVPWKTYKHFDESRNKECDVMGVGVGAAWYPQQAWYPQLFHTVSCRFRLKQLRQSPRSKSWGFQGKMVNKGEHILIGLLWLSPSRVLSFQPKEKFVGRDNSPATLLKAIMLPYQS